MYPTSSTSVLILILTCEAFGRRISINDDRYTWKSNEISNVGNGDKNLTNGTKNYSFPKEDEIVPNYLPTGFHGFISSDQGLTYGYERTKKEPKYHPGNSYKPTVRGSYPFHPSNYFYSDRLIHGQRMVSPAQIDPDVSDSLKYPVPEDRLPPVDISTDGDGEMQNTQLEAADNGIRTRKARFVGNFHDSKIPNFLPWSRRNGMSYYRPQQPGTYVVTTKNDMMDRSDQFIDYDTFDAGLPAVIHDPLPIIVAAILPLSMMLAAVLPIMVKAKISNANGSGNLPLVTTTATGNSGKNVDANDTLGMTSALGGIGKFSPRSGGHECIAKAFCRMANSEETVRLSLRKATSELTRFLDGDLLERYGLKTVFESMKDGNCNRIECR